MPSSSAAADHLAASSLAVLQIDAVIDSLSSLLAEDSKHRLSEVCKPLRLFGRMGREVTLWPRGSGVEPPRASLINLLRRQEHLATVKICGAQEMLPSLFAPLPSGYFEHLESLHLERLSSSVVTLSSLSALADAIASHRALPSLTLLNVDFAVERGGTTLLLEAFRGGACPRLHTLLLPFYYSFHVCDENVHLWRRSLSTQEESEEIHLNLTTAIDVLSGFASGHVQA